MNTFVTEALWPPKATFFITYIPMHRFCNKSCQARVCPTVRDPNVSDTVGLSKGEGL